MPTSATSTDIRNHLRDFREKMKEEPSERRFARRVQELVRRKFNRPSEVYTAAGISRQQYSEMISKRHYHVSREAALAYVFALRASFEEAQELLRSAGYAFSDSKADRLLRYCLKHNIHQLLDVNQMLDAIGCKPLTFK